MFVCTQNLQTKLKHIFSHIFDASNHVHTRQLHVDTECGVTQMLNIEQPKYGV